MRKDFGYYETSRGFFSENDVNNLVAVEVPGLAEEGL
jgi:hypothetical protein